MNKSINISSIIILFIVFENCNYKNENNASDVLNSERNKRIDMKSKENLLIIDSILKINEKYKLFSEFVNGMTENEYFLINKYLESKGKIDSNRYKFFIDEQITIRATIYPTFNENKLVAIDLFLEKPDSYTRFYADINKSITTQYFNKENTDKIISLYKSKYGKCTEISTEKTFDNDGIRNLTWRFDNKIVEIQSTKYYVTNRQYKEDFISKKPKKSNNSKSLIFTPNTPPMDFENSEYIDEFYGYYNISIQYSDLIYLKSKVEDREKKQKVEKNLKQLEIKEKQQNTVKDI